MHRCFGISEINLCIISFLAEDNGALSALTRTYKLFYEPAADLIWQRLHNLAPLIMLLPEELWEEFQKDDITLLRFTRPIFEGDLTRFRLYVNRVKTLHVGSQGTFRGRILDVDSSILIAISNVTDRAAICPSLRTLTWQERWPEELQSISLLLGPKIKRLGFTFSALACDERTGATVFENLITLCPDLEDLEIVAGTQRTSLLSDALSRLVLSLGKIQRFSSACVLVTPPAFHHLATIPTLSTLETGLSSDARHLSIVPSLAFTSLSELTLWALSLHDVMPLLQAISPSNLASAVLNVDTTPRLEDIAGVFKALRDRCPSFSLTRFYGFQINQAPRDLTNVESFTEEVLAPLLTFPYLEFLWINSYLSFDRLDNRMLTRMATSWPRLRELDLGSMSCCGSPSNATLEGLSIMAQSCPALESLGLTLSTSTDGLEEFLQRNKSGAGSKNLLMKILSVGHSSIESLDCNQVAVYLWNVYPHLQRISRWDPPEDMDDEVDRRWQWVDSRIQVFQRPSVDRDLQIALGDTMLP